MSSFKSLYSLLLLLGTGCGFQPLYQSDSMQINDDISLIKISTIADRDGQILRNYLLDMFNPFGEPYDPLYRLNIGLNVSGGSFSFRKDSTAERTIITSQANFTLTDIKSGKILLKDLAEATTAYGIGPSSNTSAFPSIVAEKAEIERAMKLLAHEIKLQVASFLASNKNHS